MEGGTGECQGSRSVMLKDRRAMVADCWIAMYCMRSGL